MEEVQTDIIFIILSKLPLKSLMKFSSVRKDWNDIIKDPFFVNLHTSISKPKPLELIMAHTSFRNKNIISMTAIRYKDDLPIVNETPVSHIVSSLSWDYVGTCNSLLCFSYYEIFALSSVKSVDIIMVCNPVTREHIFLPDQPTFTSSSYKFYRRHVAFGFDSVSKIYKVVRILEPPAHKVESESARMKVEVYTLGQNSSSRREVQVEYYKLSGDSVYANGSVYWLSRNFGYRIVKFDMENENLLIVPSPYFGSICCMRELNDSLLVLDLSTNMLVIVWKLKDDKSYTWECDHLIHLERHSLLGMQDLMLFRRLIRAHERDVYVNALFSNVMSTYEERTCNFKDIESKSFAKLNWEIYGGCEGSLVTLKDLGVVSEQMKYSVCIVSDDEMEDHLSALELAEVSRTN